MKDVTRYTIRWRWLVRGEGWKEAEEYVGTSFHEAGVKASAKAHELDALYGDGSEDGGFWTVDILGDSEPDLGSYYQLFHGRLS